MKKLRMLKVVSLATILLAVFMVSASAGEVKFSGKSSTPIFEINGDNKYCAEPNATHPGTGVDYESFTASSGYEFLDDIFVNDFLYTGNKDDEYQMAMQQAIWSRINPGTNYRMVTEVLLGSNAVAIFDQLVEEVDVDDYEIEYKLYISSEKDELGRPYQQLIDASVKEKEIPVSPIDPEPTTKAPTEPPTETTTEPPTETTTESPTETTTEPPTETTTESPTETTTEAPVETTEPEPETTTEKQTVPVLEESGPIRQQAPKTGYESGVAFLVALLALSCAAFVVTSKKRKAE